MARINTDAYRIAQEHLSLGRWSTDLETGLVLGIDGTPIGSKNKAGYVRVAVKTGDRFTSLSAHRILWEAAHGAIPEDFEVNHINGVKSDNRLVNLELLTPGDNRRHAYSMGLQLSPSRAHVKFSDETISMVHELRAQGYKYDAIATMTGISPSHTRSIGCGALRKRPLTSIGLAKVPSRLS